jgi:hypothetical protein
MEFVAEIRSEQRAEAALDSAAQPAFARPSKVEYDSTELTASSIRLHPRASMEAFTAVAERVRDLLSGSFSSACHRNSDAIEQLESVLMMNVQMIRENGVIRHLFFFPGALTDPHRAKIFQIARGYLERVAQIITRGQRAGRIRAEVDPRIASIMFLGTVRSASLLGYSQGRTEAMGQARRVLKAFLAAVETKA